MNLRGRSSNKSIQWWSLFSLWSDTVCISIQTNRVQCSRRVTPLTTYGWRWNHDCDRVSIEDSDLANGLKIYFCHGELSSSSSRSMYKHDDSTKRTFLEISVQMWSRVKLCTRAQKALYERYEVPEHSRNWNEWEQCNGIRWPAQSVQPKRRG